MSLLSTLSGGISTSYKLVSMSNNKGNKSKHLKQDVGRPRVFEFVQSGAIHYSIVLQLTDAPSAKTTDSSVQYKTNGKKNITTNEEMVYTLIPFY